MTLLEKVMEWLRTYPGMERLTHFFVDDKLAASDNGGLFPRGLTELERKEDILGNTETLNQYRFNLFYVLAKSAGDEEAAKANAEWLLGLQAWVQEQSAKGLVPALGDPGLGRETAAAEKGMLYRDTEDGAVTYLVTLTIKFKKRYEV